MDLSQFMLVCIVEYIICCRVSAEWSQWGLCSVTCGDGTQHRSQLCTGSKLVRRQVPQQQEFPTPVDPIPFDPIPFEPICPKSVLESKTCYTGILCPVNGGWNIWGGWSSCGISCGGGIQERSRSCNNPSPSNGGEFCSGSNRESRICNKQCCPVNGVWGIWTTWTPCTASCGAWSRSRLRNCNDPPPTNGGQTCPGNSNEVVECPAQSCPVVNGGWSAWSAWTTCGVSCGGSIQDRFRTCDNPSPKDGGAICSGYNRESRQCNTQLCSVNGGWSQWSAWTTCSVSCGGSIQHRSRTCTNPSPKDGGAICNGDTREGRLCNTQLCSINGGWSVWSVWTTCSVSCGGSIQHRSRTCTNPSPKDGGAICNGDNREGRLCNTQLCSINGGWSAWSVWTTCSVSCGGSIQHRSRTCTNPSPKDGGAICSGYNRDSRLCNTQQCSENGGWSQWSMWTTCSVSCGGSIQHKSRTCSNPSPKNGGDMCSGYNRESRLCNTQLCLVNESWSNWLPWTACTLTCGIGTKSRIRLCQNHTLCSGNATEIDTCAIKICTGIQQRALSDMDSEHLLKGIIGGLAILLTITLAVVLFLFRKYKDSAHFKVKEMSEKKAITSNPTESVDNQYEEIREDNLAQKGKKLKPRRCENYEMLEKKCNQVYEQLSVKDVRDRIYANTEVHRNLS